MPPAVPFPIRILEFNRLSRGCTRFLGMVNLNLADYQAPSLIRANIVEVRTSVINLNDSIIHARDFNYI
jgi:hypothetical protein